MKRFNIVLTQKDGGVELHLMKEWLRQHPTHVPPGLDASLSTSHQLRDGLRRAGWSVQETPTEVRITFPGARETVTSVLGEETASILETDSEELEAPQASFALEYQLRDFLAQNISSIDVQGKRLHVYVDPTGRDGIEYPTPVGLIDILAVDASDNFFIFELKRARTPDHAIGQLTRYMGWVHQTIGREKSVNGIIVAKEISPNLRYAVSVVPKVSLFEYEIEFHLKAVPSIPQNQI